MPILLAFGPCDRLRTSESPKPGKARKTMPATIAEAASGAVRTRLRLGCASPALLVRAERGRPPEPTAIPGVAGYRPAVPDPAAIPDAAAVPDPSATPGPAAEGGSSGILSSAKTGVAMRSGSTSAAAATAGSASVSAPDPAPGRSALGRESGAPTALAASGRLGPSSRAASAGVGGGPGSPLPPVG